MNVAANKITEFAFARQLSDFYPTNIYDIVFWCRDYERRNNYPTTIDRRFAIGFYQIHQGISWKDGGINKYEAYASATCHFMMVAERLYLCVDTGMDIRLEDFPFMMMDSVALSLLSNLSAAQQQICYQSAQNKAKGRKSRYSAVKLNKHLATTICTLISLIPSEFRSDAFQAASAIMTKDLK